MVIAQEYNNFFASQRVNSVCFVPSQVVLLLESGP